jgi:prepilin-type N-terminal cleavage/methylation domain-containing protein
VNRRGLSLLEILVVIAIIAVLAGLIAVGSRAILTGQQNRSSLYSMRQIFWQGASAATSRGEPLELVVDNEKVEVRTVKTPVKVVRRVELSNDANLSLSNGTVASFSPTGKVTMTNGNTFTLTTDGKSYRFTVSLIGEVKLEPL